MCTVSNIIVVFLFPGESVSLALFNLLGKGRGLVSYDDLVITLTCL